MRKIIFIMLTIAVMIITSPFTVKAEVLTPDLNFTDALENEKGEGWSWNNEAKVLTLFGATFHQGITLPADSSITIIENTINSITTTDTIPITTSGDLTINGKGMMSLETPVDSKGIGFDTLNGVTNLSIEDVTLNTSGLTGLLAENVSIKNSLINIYGYKYGIHATSTKQNADISVELINCTGTITGNLLQGIEIINNISGNVKLNIENSKNLIVSGNTTNKKLSGSFERSGVRVFTNGAKSNAIVTIKDSEEIYFYGTNTGIAIDCHSNSSTVVEDNGKAMLIIDNSVVKAETITSTWAAFFVNNNGVGVDATAEITIKDSNVSALAPNDVAIMTSTKKSASSVTVRNSVVELAGVYAGIRAKSNTTSDAEIFVIENSLIVAVDKTGKNYKALDEMDNATSSDGSSGVDENSKVISPKDCVITLKTDGSWDIPDGGTILINGQESNFIYGGVIKTTGDVLPYITSVNDNEFVDLNEALSTAKDGDNVVLLIPNGTENAVLPLGVMLTSPVAITVKSNEYGYKVKEEVVNEKYVYSVIPLDKFKITYHYNYGVDKTIVIDVFEQSNLELKEDIFKYPKGMEFSYWVINGEKYYPGDVYLITDDIDVYAQWEKIENPNTYDNIGNNLFMLVISLIGLMGVVFCFIKGQNKKLQSR